jgi:hypothetical protein
MECTARGSRCFLLSSYLAPSPSPVSLPLHLLHKEKNVLKEREGSYKRRQQKPWASANIFSPRLRHLSIYFYQHCLLEFQFLAAIVGMISNNDFACFFCKSHSRCSFSATKSRFLKENYTRQHFFMFATTTCIEAKLASFVSKPCLFV